MYRKFFKAATTVSTIVAAFSIENYDLIFNFLLDFCVTQKFIIHYSIGDHKKSTYVRAIGGIAA